MDTSLFTFGLLPLTCSGAHQWGRPGTSGRAGTRYLSTNADTPIELYIMARSIPSCGWQSAVCQPPRTMYTATQCVCRCACSQTGRRQSTRQMCIRVRVFVRAWSHVQVHSVRYLASCHHDSNHTVSCCRTLGGHIRSVCQVGTSQQSAVSE
jgi:hypothetical protein